MRKFIFLAILFVCVSTVFPFWLLVFEHMVRRESKSILSIILEEIQLEPKIVRVVKPTKRKK